MPRELFNKTGTLPKITSTRSGFAIETTPKTEFKLKPNLR